MNYLVLDPGAWENETGPKGWWAVCSEKDGGIVAYFRDETDANDYGKQKNTANLAYFEFDGLVLDIEKAEVIGAANQNSFKNYMPVERVLFREIGGRELQREMCEKEIDLLRKKPFTEFTEEEKDGLYRRLFPGRYRISVDKIS